MDTNIAVTLDRRSLVTQIADAIRDSILAGKLEPGAELNEAYFAEKFGVGRSTIREALRTLLAEGLLEKEHNRSWQVRQITERTVWEVAAVRGAIESLGAYLAVQQITPESEGRLRAIIDDMERAERNGNLEALNAADYRFHQAVVELSDNQILQQCWSTLASYSQIIMANRKPWYRSMQERVQAHKHLLQAVLSGDPAHAESAFKNDLFGASEPPRRTHLESEIGKED